MNTDAIPAIILGGLLLMLVSAAATAAICLSPGPLIYEVIPVPTEFAGDYQRIFPLQVPFEAFVSGVTANPELRSHHDEVRKALASQVAWHGAKAVLFVRVVSVP